MLQTWDQLFPLSCGPRWSGGVGTTALTHRPAYQVSQTPVAARAAPRRDTSTLTRDLKCDMRISKNFVSERVYFSVVVTK